MAKKLATYDYLNSLSSEDYPVSGNLGKKCVTYSTWSHATGLQTPYLNDLEYIGTFGDSVNSIYKVTTTSDWKKADPTSGWPEGCTVLATYGWNYWAICIMTVSHATQYTPAINALAIVRRLDAPKPVSSTFSVNMRYMNNSGNYVTIDQDVSYTAGGTINNVYTSGFYGVYLPGSPDAGIYATASDVYSFNGSNN